MIEAEEKLSLKEWLISLFCLFYFVFSSVCFAEGKVTHSDSIRLAVSNTFGNGITVRYFNGTVNAIAKAVAPRRLEVHFYDQEKFLEAAQKKEFDLAIASSGLTAMIVDSEKATSLLSVINSRTPNPSRANAGVIITRKDRTDINTLADLKGKTLAVSSTKAFAGFLTVMGEIEAEGLNPNSLFSSVKATRLPMPDLVQRVVNKEVDVAFIASCILENLEDDGLLAPDTIKVINEKKDSEFYCRHSTHLYPGWILSALSSLDSATLRKIVVALLDLPQEKGSGTYWTVAADFNEMNLLLQRAEVRYLEDRTLGWIFTYYRGYFITAAGLLLLLILNWIYLAFAVNRKKHELQKKVEENQEIERENHKIQARLEELEKTNSIGIISALVAHELKQPLGAINNYSEALLRQLNRNKIPSPSILEEALGEIKSEGNRAADIVDFVRGLGKQGPRNRKNFDLNDTVRRVVEIMRRGGRLSVPCEEQLSGRIVVYADPLNAELVIMNLLKNAEEALRSLSSPKIILTVTQNKTDAVVTIEDNGKPLSDEAFEALNSLGRSSKKEGLGLGLAIVRELLEANGGALKLSRVGSGGLRCTFTLPLALEKDK